jgi:type I restriction enzyme S subunit
MGNCSGYILETSEYLKSAAVNRFNVPIIPPNTVILSFKLTVGRVCISSEEMLSNEAIAHFVPKTESFEQPFYTYLYLKNFDFDSLGNTSSIATAVNSQSIKKMPFLAPDISVLNTFNNEISPLFNLLLSNDKEIQSLMKIRDTLLPKLMSGEIEV